MELFSYLSIKDIENLTRNYNIGKKVINDAYRTSNHKCKPNVNYVRCFSDFDDVRVYQAYNKTCKNSEFAEGGAVVKLELPKRLLDGRNGRTIYLVEDELNEMLEFKMVKELLLSDKLISMKDVKEMTFDKNCSTPVEELKQDLDVKKEEDFYGPINFGLDL